MERKLVALARRPRHGHRLLEIGAGPRGVVAEEVHRLAQVGDGILERLARLANKEAEQLRAVLLVEGCGLLEDDGTGLAALPVPGLLRRIGQRQRARHVLRVGLGHLPHGDAAVMGRRDRTGRTRLHLAADDRRSGSLLRQ